MNVNGEEFINRIVDRLKDEKVLLTDVNILYKLRSLNKYQLMQLADFGDVDVWRNDRLAKSKNGDK